METQSFVHWLNSGNFGQRWLKEFAWQLPMVAVFVAAIHFKDFTGAGHRFFTETRWSEILIYAVIFSGSSAFASRRKRPKETH